MPECKRPLAVILAWLAAKEKHVEKYRALWLRRGFDVLTVKMTPYQFLLPTLGAQGLMSDLLRILYSISDHYPDFILHCFSIGGYEFGEMLHQLHKGKIEKREGAEEEAKDAIERRIKGVVFDSPVDITRAASGISKSITQHAYVSKVIEYLIKTHMKVSYPFATKHYVEAGSYTYGNHLTKAPGLILVSDADAIGAPEASEILMDCWKQNGVQVCMKVFQTSGHVQHLTHHPVEYERQLDLFLSKVQLESWRM